jgi:putative tryptophan/tyrosine transport system substrate-binding protein
MLSPELGGDMNRRTFLAALVGSTAGAWPHGVRAQQPPMPVIGFMSSRSSADSAYLVAAFRQGLAESGIVERENVRVEYRWADGRYERLDLIAKEFVGRKVAVIVSVGGVPSARAAKAATSSIPIVFSVGPDPVSLGLTNSFNRPDRNATGISLLTTQMEAKRLGLIHELAPNASTISVLVNPTNAASTNQTREIEQAARSIGRRALLLHAGNEQNLLSAFATIVQDKAGALLVCADSFFDTQQDRILEFAARQRLPGVYQFREYVAAGGLASYGISLTDTYRQVGLYAARILKGAKPGDLPILQPTKFELVINLKTAKALGLAIPPTLLARADEVFE